MHNLSLYINQDCRDVILNTNSGFTIVATIRLDERADSYFGTDLWKEISKFYVLKAGTIIALHIKVKEICPRGNNKVVILHFLIS